MCGIAGFFGQQPRDPAQMARMQTAIAPRGPDGQQAVFWTAQGDRLPPGGPAQVAMLHSRLAVRDLRSLAAQPMSNDDGSVWLCYNGEVYGWEEEAAALARQGVLFRTTSDTEFILRAYEAWGLQGMLPKLRGMFAFTILDWRVRKLWLVRDRLGLKPLVYARDPQGSLAFGSTVRSVLPFLQPEQQQFDRQSLLAYLAHRYIPAPRTVFEQVARLENAHWLEYDLNSGAVRKQLYWQPETRSACDQSEAIAELAQAVHLRTVADRPVGVFLSGGVDSSCVASLLVAQGHADLTAFTAGFPASAFDESDEAAKTAQTLGLRHQVLPLATSLANDFEQVVADLDEPFADPSSFPTWALAKATVQHVQVVLSGDGGDELFAGYKRYTKHLRTAWRRQLHWPGLPPQPQLQARGVRHWLEEVRMPWWAAYSLRFSGFSPAQRYFLTGAHDADTYWRAPEQMASTPLETLLALDWANTLPEYILRKADLCTAVHGLELRAPLLDHCWVERVLALPYAERFTHPRKKMLAAAMPQLADLQIFQRPKRGFNPPLRQALRVELAERLPGLGTRLEQRTEGLLRSEAVDAFVTMYQLGGEWAAEQVLQLLILDTSLRQLRS